MKLSDDQLKDLLQKMEIPFDESSWSVLKNKMDTQVHLEDLKMKETLSELNIPYQPDSWAKLNDQLQQISAKQKLLTLGKIVEVAFLIFFTWAFINLDSGTVNQPPLALNPLLNLPDHPYQPIDRKQQFSHATPVTTNKGQAVNEINPNRSLSAPKKELYRINDSLLSVDLKTDQLIWKEDRTLTHILTELQLINDEVKEETIQGNQEAKEEQALAINHLDSSDFLEESIGENEIPPIPLKESEETALMVEDIPIIEPYIGKQLQKYYISGAISYDRDLIRTPYPHQLSVNHLGRIERSYHAELNVFAARGNIEFQTGISFWFKEYQSVYEGTNDAMVFSIPLNARLKLSQNGFMRGYLMGGISAHFIAYANYRETTFLQEDASAFVPNNVQARVPSFLSSDSYDHGILEGETLKGNHFFTANMGIGVDFPLNARSSLYLEQVYFHHLSGGIGPAFDKFSTSSTVLGFRYLIGTK